MSEPLGELCGSCHRVIQAGALRCRHCGAKPDESKRLKPEVTLDTPTDPSDGGPGLTFKIPAR